MIKLTLKNFRKEFYKRAFDVVTRLLLCLMLPVMVVRQVFFKLSQRKGSGNKTVYFIDNQGRSIVGWLGVLNYLFVRGKEQSRPGRNPLMVSVSPKGKLCVFYEEDQDPVIRIDQQGNVHTQVDNRGPEAFREYANAPAEACQLGCFSLFNRLGFVDLATSVQGLSS